jgi:hypothetical protein
VNTDTGVASDAFGRVTDSADHTAAPDEMSIVAVNLLKGPIYRDSQERLWVALLKVRNRLTDHFAVVGLLVEIDEAEGYSYLRSRPGTDGSDDFPRLIARRSLPFHVSLLLALLRKRLAEFDASNSDTRLTMTRDEIVEMLRLFLPESTNQARLVDVIGGQINRVVEMGFLRRMNGQDDLFEVRRILKAYVDAQWLSDFDARLDEYLRESAKGGAGNSDGDQ